MSFLSCPWSRVVYPGRVFLIILSKWSHMLKTREEKSSKNWVPKKKRERTGVRRVTTLSLPSPPQYSSSSLFLSRTLARTSTNWGPGILGYKVTLSIWCSAVYATTQKQWNLVALTSFSEQKNTDGMLAKGTNSTIQTFYADFEKMRLSGVFLFVVRF